MQQLQIIGRLGQDCKVIDHQGRKFVSFSVAVDDDYKDATGQKIDRTVWYDCNMDNTAVSTYLKKGTQVFIQGKPRVEQYQSSQDSKWYAKCRVAVSRIQLLGSANDRPATNDLPPSTSPSPQPAKAVQQNQSVPANGGDGDNDLPF
jgi:single-strand DNA-binding protein